MSIYTQGVTFGSIDLGVENLGVWAGRAKVTLADPDVKVPVTKGYWSSTGDDDGHNFLEENSTKFYETESKNDDRYDALTIHTRDRAFTFETLYWDRINLAEGLPTTVKTVKKKDSSLHRQVIKPSLDVQVDYAIREEKIPAIIQRFRELGVTDVLIESQLTNMGKGGGGPMATRQAAVAGNITMKVMSHVIQALLRKALPDASITFVSGHSTLPLCEDIMWAPTSKWTQILGLEREPRGTPRTKTQKKAFAKNAVKYVLELVYGSAASSRQKGTNRKEIRKHYPEVLNNYLTSKKKDDLADSMLQVLGFLRKCPLTTPRKKKSGKPVKRKRGELPAPEVDDTSRLDMKMYNFMMRKKMKQEKPPTIAAMKATLQAWKCKGFASLKKPQMLEFFEAAKAVREKAGKSTSLKPVSSYKPEDTGAYMKRYGGQKGVKKEREKVLKAGKQILEEKEAALREPAVVDEPYLPSSPLSPVNDCDEDDVEEDK